MQRIHLAARAGSRERDLLALDTNLQVLDGLSRNPNLNPPEVERLLRTPQLLPQTLETLSRRWASVESLKLLIATHPNAALDLATRLVATLGPAARQRALQRAGLRPLVRDKLRKK